MYMILNATSARVMLWVTWNSSKMLTEYLRAKSMKLMITTAISFFPSQISTVRKLFFKSTHVIFSGFS